MATSSTKISFSGQIISVKARIRLCRSFDEISHQYQGYTLVVSGDVEDVPTDEIRVAIGPAAHNKHQFRIGDMITGKAHPIIDPQTEWAQYYKASALKITERGSAEQNRPADMDGGIAPILKDYRANGHVRLAKKTCENSCKACPFGLTMATEITVDQWNPSDKKWRFETHCYGPAECPRYKSGPARKVPGRNGMSWTDNDLERRGENDQQPNSSFSEDMLAEGAAMMLAALSPSAPETIVTTGFSPQEMMQFKFIAAVIENARLAKNASIKEMAKILKCRQLDLKNIEACSLVAIRIDVLRKYAKHLDVESALLGWFERHPDLRQKMESK